MNRIVVWIVVVSCVSASKNSAQEAPPVNVPELRQPERILPDGAGSEARRLPPVPTPDGLQLPPWLLPDAPAKLGGGIVDSNVKLATAASPVPRRAAALYAQAEKFAVGAKTHGELTVIIDLCKAARNGQPSDELNSQLNRLCAWAYNRRGEVFISDGDERAAFDDFSRAIACDKDCWSAFHNRAVTYATYGQKQDALNDFAEALRINPEAVEVYRNRAELNLQMDNLQAAIDDLTLAIARSAGDGDLRSLRGDVYHRMGKPDLAAREYDSAVELGSESASTLAHRALLAARAGDFDRATIDYDTALERDPYHAETYRGVAWLLATCPDVRYRDESKALEAAKRAQRFGAANDPSILDAVAAAHANAGDFDAAIQYAEQAATLATHAERNAILERISRYRDGQPYRSPW